MKKIIMGLSFVLIVAAVTTYMYLLPEIYRFQKAVEQMDKGPRFLFVVPNLEQTGAQIILVDLLKLLHRHNKNVAVIAYKDGSLHNVLNKLEIPVLVDEKLEFDKKTFEKVVKLFDGVICNTLYTSNSYLLAKDIRPTIWWIHEISDMEDYVLNIMSSLDISGNLFPAAVYVVTQAKNVVVVSDFVKDYYKEFLPQEPDVIYNIITENLTQYDKNGEIYRQIAADKKAGKMVFITVGYIGWLKGADVLTDAILSLPETYRDKAAFYVVGTFDGDFTQKLMDRTKNLPQVKWFEPIKHMEIGQVYAVADVLLHPSRRDAFPLSVLEAASFEIPAVITEKNGTASVLRDKEGCFVIPTDDAEALKSKIMYFMDNPQKVEQMGKTALEHFQKQISPEKFYSEWQKKLDALVASPK